MTDIYPTENFTYCYTGNMEILWRFELFKISKLLNIQIFAVSNTLLRGHEYKLQKLCVRRDVPKISFLSL